MLKDKDYLRFGRQLLLPQWGEAGQQALASKRVLIIGLGGLGCPALQYLAGAGVGAGAGAVSAGRRDSQGGLLRLVDGDAVSLSNLPRQTLFTPSHVGQNKAKAAKAWLTQHNPDIAVEGIEQMASADNLPTLLEGIDLVLDCTDNLTVRHAINRACVRNNIPLVSGAAIGWQGQLMVIAPSQPTSACFACLSDPDSDDSQAASCQEAGVVGPVVGAVGTLQALQGLKLLLGLECDHQLHRFDGLTMQWQAFALEPVAACTVCGQKE
ncbi:HesA/MoeB/ThiF family protein [Ferrimonas marina]|uniref:Sulfur carrier protein ThiS adenylyltransferase n=1 Tax=Ferrimonas marina TaxID=299255 RepID=A0A1M5NPK0_9GAMM|nr:HesA/MoeB/ThiF family protein [Ferrimonas marina]SHG91407.1 sulfur carrier protein ThiS adenylyltransferase [Ferrimonas marina]